MGATDMNGGTGRITGKLARRGRIWLRAAATLAVAGLMIWGWNATKYHVFPKRFRTVVTGQVYRCGQMTRTVAERTLRKHGIKVIVDLTAPLAECRDQAAEQVAAVRLAIAHYRFPQNGDGTGDIRLYADALAVVHAARMAGQPVLVHCAAGSERTGVTVGFYQLLVEGKPPRQVWDGILQAGHRPRRNPKLRAYMNAHMAEMAGLLKERGLIERLPDPTPVLVL